MFGSLLKAAVGVAVSPIKVAADVVTLGGAINDRKESYTVEALREVFQNLENATKPDSLR
ncbi:hypothetical protein [Xanthomonas phage BUDD]|nr:hypothetical protein [Xanthomonas phage BUDD]